MFGLGMRKEHLKGRWESEREKKKLWALKKGCTSGTKKVWNHELKSGMDLFFYQVKLMDN